MQYGGRRQYMVVITTIDHKPKDCTVCPLCDSYDDCMLLPMHYDEWDDQYRQCPLKEVKETVKQ